MNRAQNVAGLGLLLIAIAAGVWWGGGRSEAPPTSPDTYSTVTSATPPATITVHVAGLVSRPGLVELTEGSRVADAIAAAGGMLPAANAASINLAALVADGDQIVILGPGGVAGPSGAKSPSGRLDLNRATAAELDALPGVGPVIAERIISFREEFGPFQSVDDLLDVPGIGEARLADLRERLQVS